MVLVPPALCWPPSLHDCSRGLQGFGGFRAWDLVLSPSRPCCGPLLHGGNLCALRLADPWLGLVACCMICPGPFVPRLQCPTPSPCGLVEVTAVFHLLRFDALAWCSPLPCAGLPACMSVQGACKVSVALGLQTLCSHGVAPVVGRFLHGGLCPSFPVPVSLLV